MQLKPLSMKFKKRIFSYFIIFILSAVIFLSLVFISQFFTVKIIEVKNLSSHKALSNLEALKGQNLLFLNEKDTESFLVDQNPGIVSISVHKVYPSHLQVEVSFYQPLALFKANTGYFALAQNGQIIAKEKGTGTQLPVINYYQKMDYAAFNTGEKLEYKDIKTSLNLLKIVLNLGLNVDTIDVDGTDVIVFNLKGKTINFSTARAINTQQYELETIVRRFKIEGKDFKSLDLRFDKPIVKF